MLTDALSYVEQIFAALIGWMNQLFNSIPGSVQLIVSVFAIYCSVRLLITPIVGAGIRIGASDLVRSSRRKSNSEEK